jgi:hypothetical protein
MRREKELIGPESKGAALADQAFLSPRELARVIGVERSTLAAWRRRGVGPPWYRIQGHLVRYGQNRVIAWIEMQSKGEQLPAAEGE